MRFRVLPLVIFAFAVSLIIKAGDFWSDLDLATLFDFDGSRSETTVADPGRPPRPSLVTVEAQLIPTAGAEEGEKAEDEAGQAEAPPAESDPEAVAAMSSEPAPSTDVHDPFDLSDEEIELLEQLAVRRQELVTRGRELEQRAALLQAAERRIEDKIEDLKALQAIIEGLLVKHDEQEEAQMRSLVKIYESMKPKEAARIFEGLDMVVLLDVIGRMKERKSAPILAKMNPDKAKAVTIELAQRRELPIAKD